MTQESASDTFRKLGPAGPLAVVSLIFPVVGSIFLFRHLDQVAHWLTGQGSAGALVYAAAFAALAGLALMPTYAMSALGGWVFKIALGIPAALLGIGGAAVIGFFIARRASGERVLHVIAEKPRWEAIRTSLLASTPLKTLAMVTLLRLPPNSPFALTNLVLASVRVPLWIYLTGTLVGIAPRTALAVYIASGLEDLTRESLDAARPTWLFGATIGISLVVILTIGGLANRALERLTAPAGPAQGAAPSTGRAPPSDPADDPSRAG